MLALNIHPPACRLFFKQHDDCVPTDLFIRRKHQIVVFSPDKDGDLLLFFKNLYLRIPFSALKSQDTGVNEAEGDEGDDGEDVSSTAGPALAGGLTEKPNSTSNERSSQILYVITSSPGKPEHSMPGQWAGRGETTGPNASM